MKSVITNIIISTSLALSASLSTAKSDFNYYYQCQQMCGHTANGEILTFVTNNTNQAEYLMRRSCENMGKELWGKMECKPIKITQQNTEPYQDCLNGVTVNKGFICSSDGSVFILKKGQATQTLRLIYNFSRNSFAESDQVLLQNCKRYEANNPGAEVLCGLWYHSVIYSPKNK